MRIRELSLNLNDPGGATLTERIARAIEKAVSDGRLIPGTVLPGSRSLAESLGVTRNTVQAALDDLIAEGWLVTEPWRGTFVAPKPPITGKAPQSLISQAKSQALGFDLPSRFSTLSTGIVDVINLADGLADSSLAPMNAMGKAYQRALKTHGDRLLGQGEPQGNILLREMIAAWVSDRHGLKVGPERVMITRGSRSGFRLICDSLLKPGDNVAVEEPGNRTIWGILSRGRKVDLHSLKVDAQGVVPESLENALEKGPIRMLYLTPRRQFPTGAVMGPERAQCLLALAAKHRIAIFEDDSDSEIQFGEQRALPLLARDNTGQVIFGASLSRLVAPGTSLGYLVVPVAMASNLARARRDLETQGDRVSEWAFADLMRDEELARHLRRSRKVYEARRDHLCGLLRQELGEYLDFEVPSGGMALWLKGCNGVDLDAWTNHAKDCGLILKPPSHFYLDEPSSRTRMGFTQVDEAGLTEAVQRLKQALVRIGRR